MFIHTDGTGKRMLVAEMSDEHLSNMVRMLLTRIKDTQKYLDTVESGEVPKLNSLHRVLYGNIFSADNKEKAEEIMASAVSTLPKYILETAIRGLDFSKELQDTFGRHTALAQVTPGLFLSAINSTKSVRREIQEVEASL